MKLSVSFLIINWKYFTTNAMYFTNMERQTPPKVERPELFYSSRNILNQTNEEDIHKNEDYKSRDDQTLIPAVQI